MTQKKDILLLYFLLLIEVVILLNSKIVIKSVIESSSMFFIKIFPSLLPTMIIGLLLVKFKVYKIIPKIIKKTFNFLFNFNDVVTSIFICSMICGSPSSASFINEYLKNGLISEKTAENLLCCTHFINPLFVIGTVGIGTFNNSKIGIIILLITYFSNFVKAFILRKNFIYEVNVLNDVKTQDTSFINMLKDVIKISMSQLLVILGIVILFNILTSLLGNLFKLSYNTQTMINIILEITGGITKIKYLQINNIVKMILSYYALSFGGLCIWMQTISMITNKKIKYLKYFIFRLF